MILNEIKTNLTALSRQDKFHIIRFLLAELSTEEYQELSRCFSSGSQQGFWSQYDAFEAAQKLQTLLETKVSQ